MVRMVYTIQRGVPLGRAASPFGSCPGRGVSRQGVPKIHAAPQREGGFCLPFFKCRLCFAALHPSLCILVAFLELQRTPRNSHLCLSKEDVMMRPCVYFIFLKILRSHFAFERQHS